MSSRVYALPPSKINRLAIRPTIVLASPYGTTTQKDGPSVERERLANARDRNRRDRSRRRYMGRSFVENFLLGPAKKERTEPKFCPQCAIALDAPNASNSDPESEQACTVVQKPYRRRSTGPVEHDDGASKFAVTLLLEDDEVLGLLDDNRAIEFITEDRNPPDRAPFGRSTICSLMHESRFF